MNISPWICRDWGRISICALEFCYIMSAQAAENYSCQDGKPLYYNEVV